jgi:TetR/AcrR family fatty acid metabolism transcriptional regulator
MLDAAGRLFGTQRFHEVRMEDIAAEAEVGKGTLYRYFIDKEELYLALLRRASASFVRRLEQEMQRGETARERLEATVAAILSFFDEQPHLLDLIQRAEVMQRPGKEFPWQRTRDDLVRLMGSLFAYAKQRGEFTVRDADLAGLMLLGGLRSVIRFGKRPRAKDLPRKIVTEFLDGVSHHPGCGSSAATACDHPVHINNA